MELNFRHETSYWWFVGRRRIVQAVLDRFRGEASDGLCLDAGCGTGVVLGDLRRLGRPVGADRSDVALQFCRARGETRLVRADLTKLPFADGTFAVVTILGVLCTQWIPDEVAVLRELARVTRQGGIMISDEGAFPILLSRHNRRVGGTKRWRRSDLIRFVSAAGYRVCFCSYWNCALFPVFLLAKMIDRLLPDSRRGCADLEMPLPALINRWLGWLLNLEARWLGRGCRLPFGTALITVGEKP